MTAAGKQRNHDIIPDHVPGQYHGSIVIKLDWLVSLQT